MSLLICFNCELPRHPPIAFLPTIAAAKNPCGNGKQVCILIKGVFALLRWRRIFVVPLHCWKELWGWVEREKEERGRRASLIFPLLNVLSHPHFWSCACHTPLGMLANTHLTFTTHGHATCAHSHT